MTVINHNARNQYVATLGQTIFNYTFEIAANTDILVYQRAAAATPDDTTDILVLTTDYTVTGAGGENGGTIVLVSGAAAGDFITIQGNAPPSRSTSFTPNGVINAQNLNLEFDNDILIYQTILATTANLVPQYPKSAYIQAYELILPQLTAGKVWQMNAGATAIIASTLLSGEDLASNAAGLGASLIGLHPTGTVQDLADAPFILKTADPAAPNAQSIGALGSGVLKGTTGSGVISISNSLTSLDSLTTAANQMAYSNGVNTWALTSLTAYARSLLDDATLSDAQVTLGLVIGTNVQAYNANLQSMSGLGSAANKMLYTTGVNTWAETDLSAYTRTLLDNADLAAWQLQLGIPGGGGAYFAIVNNLSEGVPATMRTNLGLVIGTDVQAFDATLQSLSSLGTGADKIAYTTGVDTWAEAGITALGRSLIDDATQADMNTTIGSVPLAGGTMTGALYLSGSPTTGSQAATKDYCDSLVQNDQQACNYATTTNLAGYTYANGALGAGATLTAGGNGAFSTDGFSPALNDRILVLFQTAAEQNGAYTLTQVGTAGTPAILTRATDWDVAGEMQAGDVFAVVAGTLYGASQWMFATTGVITVGTTALNFTQLAGQGALLKANNLSDLPSAATARTNLGLVIGTNVQAQDATLQSIAALGTAADKMIYTTGIDTWAELTTTAFGRSLAGIAGNNGGVLVTSNTGVASMLANPAAAGRVLQSGNAAIATWSTPTYPSASGTARKILLSDGTNIVYSTETWAVPGTSGYQLTSDGTNWISSPPTVNPSVCNVRLTLTSAVPVTTSDVTAATTVYAALFSGNKIALYDGASTWNLISFTETAITVPSTTSTMYDVFVYNNAGTATFETVAWSTDTARATGLAYQDGVLIKNGATTRRYIGSFRTTTVSGQTEDSVAKRYVWNYYNRALRQMKAVDATANWTYSTNSFRQANNSAANQLDMVIGVSQDMVFATCTSQATNSTVTARTVTNGIGLDSTTVNSAPVFTNENVTTTTLVAPFIATYNGYPGAGRHYLTWLEKGAGTDTQQWYGANSAQNGIVGYLFG